MKKTVEMIVVINKEDDAVSFLGINEYLGVGYIKSYLRRYNIDSKIHIIFSNETDKMRTLFEEAPMIVAFSFYTDNAKFVLQMARILKQVHPETHISIGGPQVLGFNKKIVEDNEFVDSVMVGDGEETMYDLAERIWNHDSLAGCLGVTYRDENKKVQVNGVRPQIQDLNSLDFPDRDIFKMERQEYLYISGARGCLGICSFCGEMAAKVGQKMPFVRYRTPENIVDEMESLYREFKINCFRFTDPTFEDPGQEGIKKAEGVFDEIIKRNLNFRMHIFSRAELITEESRPYLKKAFQAGLECIYLGIESGNEQDLKLYHKGATLEDNYRAIRIIQEEGIHVGIGFICFNPYSTYESLLKNADFLYHSGLGHVFYLYQTRLEVLASSVIQKKMIKDNLLRTDADYLLHFYDYKFQNERICELHGIIKQAFEKTPIYYMDTLLGMDRVWVRKHIQGEKLKEFEALFQNLDEIKKKRAELNYHFFCKCVMMSRDGADKTEIEAYCNKEGKDIYYEEYEKLYFKINTKVKKQHFKMYNIM